MLYPEVAFCMQISTFTIIQWKYLLYFTITDILPGTVILLKDNELKKQQIAPNTEQIKGRNLSNTYKY